MEKAGDTHQRSGEPQQQVGKIDPLKVRKLHDVPPIRARICVVASESGMEPAEDGAPDEKDYPIPNEGDSHVVVGDERWD